jgi:hypothetical protein
LGSTRRLPPPTSPAYQPRPAVFPVLLRHDHGKRHYCGIPISIIRITDSYAGLICVKLMPDLNGTPTLTTLTRLTLLSAVLLLKRSFVVAFFCLSNGQKKACDRQAFFIIVMNGPSVRRPQRPFQCLSLLLYALVRGVSPPS